MKKIITIFLIVVIALSNNATAETLEFENDVFRASLDKRNFNTTDNDIPLIIERFTNGDLDITLRKINSETVVGSVTVIMDANVPVSINLVEHFYHDYLGIEGFYYVIIGYDFYNASSKSNQLFNTSLSFTIFDVETITETVTATIEETETETKTENITITQEYIHKNTFVNEPDNITVTEITIAPFIAFISALIIMSISIKKLKR